MKPHVDRADWMDKALCREYTARLFFRDPGSRRDQAEEYRKTRTAKAICGRCPVRRQCLEYALESERAGSTVLGMAEYVSWWKKDCDHEGCAKHYTRRPFPEFVWKEATASVTPPVGIWGGLSAAARHRKDIKHVELDGKTCVNGVNCPGCRPTDEWVEMLLKEDAA